MRAAAALAADVAIVAAVVVWLASNVPAWFALWCLANCIGQ